ncbi:Shedu anti-phage system protein SduA domain-containing protein, partial [Acinetobacter baumannii]
IYRIVSKKYISAPVWKGMFKNIDDRLVIKCEELNVKLNLLNISLSLSQVISTLTFGAYGEVLDIKLPTSADSFGIPFIMEKIGFFPADLNNKRFFNYIEIYGHASSCAWDARLMNLRVKNDLRRDFAKHLANLDDKKGGVISFGENMEWVENYTNRLLNLEVAINEFRQVLHFHSHETEEVFHKLMEKHPLLLDVYGKVESKPKLVYPAGEFSPIGKTYVEPDFIISYSDQSYKLIELERASKNVVTSQGQPRAEVGQAAFQTAEWTHFISEHYNLIRKQYPSINV